MSPELSTRIIIKVNHIKIVDIAVFHVVNTRLLTHIFELVVRVDHNTCTWPWKVWSTGAAEVLWSDILKEDVFAWKEIKTKILRRVLMSRWWSIPLVICVSCLCWASYSLNNHGLLLLSAIFGLQLLIVLKTSILSVHHLELVSLILMLDLGIELIHVVSLVEKVNHSWLLALWSTVTNHGGLLTVILLGVCILLNVSLFVSARDINRLVTLKLASTHAVTPTSCFGTAALHHVIVETKSHVWLLLSTWRPLPLLILVTYNSVESWRCYCKNLLFTWWTIFTKLIVQQFCTCCTTNQPLFHLNKSGVLLLVLKQIVNRLAELMLFLVFNFLDFASWLIIINYFLHFRRRSCFSGSHVSDFSRWSKAQDLQLRVTSCLEIVIHTLAWRLLRKISPTWIYWMKSEIILLNIFILDAVKIGISLSVLKLLSSLAFAGLQAFHLWILLLSLHVVLVLEV